VAIKPLTNKQRNKIAEVVAVEMVKPLSVDEGADEARARSFLANADAVADDLPRVSQHVTRHDLAYSVVHDVGEAMLAAYGYRTNGDEGGHQGVVVFLTAVFDAPPASDAAVRSDIARQNRNSRYYRAYAPSQAEADQLVADALTLLAAAHLRVG